MHNYGAGWKYFRGGYSTRVVEEQREAIERAGPVMEEVIGVSDRILVMHEGQISGELRRDQFSEHNVMQLAVGKAMNSEPPC